VSNITKVHIQPLMQGTTEILDESRLGTLLSDAEKDTLDVPRVMAYEYARLNLDDGSRPTNPRYVVWRRGSRCVA
jgi:hypothetical protein